MLSSQFKGRFIICFRWSQLVSKKKLKCAGAKVEIVEGAFERKGSIHFQNAWSQPFRKRDEQPNREKNCLTREEVYHWPRLWPRTETNFVLFLLYLDTFIFFNLIYIIDLLITYYLSLLQTKNEAVDLTSIWWKNSDKWIGRGRRVLIKIPLFPQGGIESHLSSSINHVF